MSNGINRWYGIGNLGGDPEVRHMQNGDPVCNFSIAITDTWKDQQGQKQEKTEWLRICAFKKLAEICGQYLKKGSKVYIDGSIRTRKWQKDGQDQYTTEIIARDMKMLDSRPQGQQPQQDYAGPPGAQQQPRTDFDDNIPF